jgi:hypothetical protein
MPQWKDCKYNSTSYTPYRLRNTLLLLRLVSAELQRRILSDMDLHLVHGTFVVEFAIILVLNIGAI